MPSARTGQRTRRNARHEAGPGSSRFPLPFTFPDGRKLAFGAPGYDDAFMRASAATLETLQVGIAGS
jgi:hypothetical protein